MSHPWPNLLFRGLTGTGPSQLIADAQDLSLNLVSKCAALFGAVETFHPDPHTERVGTNLCYLVNSLRHTNPFRFFYYTKSTFRNLRFWAILDRVAQKCLVKSNAKYFNFSLGAFL